MKTLFAISGAEEQQEKPVPCLEPRQREQRQAWLAVGLCSHGGQCTTWCLGCGKEAPWRCCVPATCSGTMESVATLTLGAPTLSLELVLAAELAHPRVSG